MNKQIVSKSGRFLRYLLACGLMVAGSSAFSARPGGEIGRTGATRRVKNALSAT